MGLLGRILLSAALLTLCCVGAQMNTTSSKALTNPASNETSAMNTSKAATAGDTANSTTIANSLATAQPTKASAHGSLSASNGTARTGTTESPAPSSVTLSRLALTTPEPHNKTATEVPADKNATQRSTQETHQKLTEGPAESNTVRAHSEKQDHPSYATIILPVIIALIVISLSVFLLVILYKMCLKTTPERQENGTEQAPLDKENVKLISVKTTSPENGMSSFLTLSSYDLPLGVSLPLEPFKPMRSGFSREEQNSAAE